MRKLLIASVAMLVMLPMGAAARGRGGFAARPSYHHFEGRHFGGRFFAPRAYFGFGLGWYDPFWGPYYGDYWYAPYYYEPYVSHADSGKVKLDTDVKNAEVYVDGARAGEAGNLKTMWLKAGTHTIELRAPGYATYSENIYVVAGKTITLHPELQVAQAK